MLLVHNVNTGIIKRVFQCRCIAESCPVKVVLLYCVGFMECLFGFSFVEVQAFVTAEHTLFCLACVLEFCPMDESIFSEGLAGSAGV